MCIRDRDHKDYICESNKLKARLMDMVASGQIKRSNTQPIALQSGNIKEILVKLEGKRNAFIRELDILFTSLSLRIVQRARTLHISGPQSSRPEATLLDSNLNINSLTSQELTSMLSSLLKPQKQEINNFDSLLVKFDELLQSVKETSKEYSQKLTKALPNLGAGLEFFSFEDLRETLNEKNNELKALKVRLNELELQRSDLIKEKVETRPRGYTNPEDPKSVNAPSLSKSFSQTQSIKPIPQVSQTPKTRNEGFGLSTSAQTMTQAKEGGENEVLKLLVMQALIKKMEEEKQKKSQKEAAEFLSFLGVAVHTGITCTKCRICPIVGVRYKCITCEDCDLCEDCKKQGHPHIMLAINKNSSQMNKRFFSMVNHKLFYDASNIVQTLNLLGKNLEGQQNHVHAFFIFIDPSRDF
eukprot:TRINITY_DN986_c0_g1_i4.p1 TRINITY_DN986_c0_g1~~TRINITY_DN986_c0_g1_i4.p1  ORF type:complete len:413 (-),score=45.56 TRINITY_DN986_c0_g1_i4:104-1342(-)